MQLNIPSSYTGDDEEIEGYIDGITPVVEQYTGEIMESREVVEEVELQRASRFMLHWAPVESLISVRSVNGVAVEVDSLHVSTETGLVSVIGGGKLTGIFTVTYQAGHDEAPANYKRGALIILQHVWETQRGTNATLLGGVVGTEEGYDPRWSYSIPRKALEWLGSPMPRVS